MQAVEHVRYEAEGWIFWAQVESKDSLEWKLVSIHPQEGIRILNTGTRVLSRQIKSVTNYWRKSEGGNYYRMLTLPADTPTNNLPPLFLAMAHASEKEMIDVSDDEYDETFESER